MNQKIIEFLGKVSRVLDQVAVGQGRAGRNVDTAVKIIQAARAANIGNDTNALLDALLPVAQKTQLILGGSPSSPAKAQ